MRKITKEDLVTKYQDYLTVGDLREILYKIPVDTKVVVQRVKDKYYDGIDISGIRGCLETPDGIYPAGSKSTGWGVFLKKGEVYYNAEERNKEMQDEIDRRSKGEEPEYPSIKDPKDYMVDLTEEFMEQYTPAFCCFYNDDVLFINLHY